MSQNSILPVNHLDLRRTGVGKEQDDIGAKLHEVFYVVLAHAGVDEHAVVVHQQHAAVTARAVVSTEGLMT